MKRKNKISILFLATLVFAFDGFMALKIGLSQSLKLKGNEMMLLSSQGNAQMLSIVIKSENGELVVIDGGWEEDGEHLLNVIQKNGGHVNAWLVTHPHPDHVGALYYILKNNQDDITIDHIYYSFAPVEWYAEVSPGDEGMVYVLQEEFAKLSDDILCGSINQEDRIIVDNMNIIVMNDRYELNSDPINNSSIVYRIEMNNKTLLFLGDLGYYGGAELSKDNDSMDLKADIVQMAHHGQNGVDRNIYEMISPKICLWPTPEWLWYNDAGYGPGSGQWETEKTRKWTEELKVEANYCIKDGDQKIKIE